VYTPDNNTKPEYTSIQAGQSPTPPPTNVNLFAGGDRTTPTGGIPISTLPSGPGYAVLYSGFDVSSLPPLEFVLPSTTGTATFDDSGRLSTFSDGSNTDKPTTHVEGFTDGIIAWGRWSGGTVGGVAVSDTHYLTGMPTPSSALATLETANFQGLGAGKAVYSFMGATQPTSASGAVGSGVTGSLTVQFSAGSASVATLLNVPINGGIYAITNSGMTGSFPAFAGSASMTCSGSCSGAGTGAQLSGSFFGPMAERAGLNYSFTGASAVGSVTGAAAFAR
jgi:hypothetical protein